jgi:hypothetical protein
MPISASCQWRTSGRWPASWDFTAFFIVVWVGQARGGFWTQRVRRSSIAEPARQPTKPTLLPYPSTRRDAIRRVLSKIHVASETVVEVPQSKTPEPA